MIYSIGVLNAVGDLMFMELRNPFRNGLNVKNITGISPGEASIYTTEYAMIDGSIYNGSRSPSRQIVLTIGLLPVLYRKLYPDRTDDTITRDREMVENARRYLYDFFRIKDPVTLIFYTDHRTLQIEGYTSNIDIDVFSKDETATVSVDCPDPWFYEALSDVSSMGFAEKFEFPFSNESLTEPQLLFSVVSSDTRLKLFYSGDIAVGMSIHLTFSSSDFHNIYLYDMDSRARMDIYTDQIELMTGSMLSETDEIFISTSAGRRSAYLLRDGSYINILNAIDKNATWFKLKKGNNIIAYSSDSGVGNISMAISYRNAYAGV